MIYINNEPVEEVIIGQGGGSVNLDDYYKKTETYSKQEIDDKNFLTEHQSLSHLATKAELSNYQKSGDYVTNTELSQKGFLTDIPAEYITETELNDKHYLTEHQSLSGYAKEEWVNNQIDSKLTGGTEVDLTDYYKKNETYSKEEIDQKGYLTEHQSIEHLATKEEVNGKADKEHTHDQYLTSHQDISGKLDTTAYTEDKKSFALKSEIPDTSNLATKDELNGKLDAATYNQDKPTFATKDDLSGYQKLGDYVTNEVLNQKGYLTEHQKLKTINNQEITGEGNITIEATGGDVSGKLDVSVYEEDKKTFATKDEIPTKYLTDVVNKGDVISFSDNLLRINPRKPEPETVLGDKDIEFIKINSNPIFNFGSTHHLGDIGNINIYSKEEIDGKGYLTSHQDISGKLDKETYDSEKVNYATKSDIPDTSHFVTNEALDQKHYLTQHQSIEHLATKDELNGKADKVHTHDQYLTEHQNLKTINNQSLIGEGNITIEAGTSITVDDHLDAESLNPVQNKIVTNELNQKIESVILTQSEYDELLVKENNVMYIISDAPEAGGDVSGKLDVSVYEKDKATFATKTDLEGYQEKGDYVTNEALNGKGYLTEIPAEYVTETELNDKHYLTEHQDISGKVDRTELSNYQEKGDYVTNEVLDQKGYLTQHQSIEHLATKDELNGKADKVHSHPEYLTEHQNIDHKLDTATYNQEKETFATKSELSSYQKSGDYVTNTELNQKNYLTEHQSIEHLATKDELNGKADKSDIPSDYLVRVENNESRLNFIKNNSVQVMAPEVEYLQQNEAEFLTINNKPIFSFGQSHSLGEIGNINLYSKEEIDQKGYLTEHQDISGKADKTYVDQLVGEINTKITEIKTMI